MKKHWYYRKLDKIEEDKLKSCKEWWIRLHAFNAIRRIKKVNLG